MEDGLNSEACTLREGKLALKAVYNDQVNARVMSSKCSGGSLSSLRAQPRCKHFVEVRIVNIDQQLVDLTLSVWKSDVGRVTKFFRDLSDEELQREICPGKNRLIYLLGHLTAVHDALFPLFGLGESHYPEMREAFITSPDRAPVQDGFSGEDLKHRWLSVNEALLLSFDGLSPSQWLEKHTAVSDEDFKQDPSRNRFTVFLRRTGHLSYHLGQIMLAKKQ
jgi:hypothetical protein